jgi:anti-anti-sigma factor
MACSLDARMEGDAQILTFDGSLDTEAAQQIGPLVKEAFLGGAKKLIFDLAKVPYVASMGLAVFINAIQSFPGKVMFAATQPYVRQTLKLAGFDKLTTMCKTVDDALAS